MRHIGIEGWERRIMMGRNAKGEDVEEEKEWKNGKWEAAGAKCHPPHNRVADSLRRYWLTCLKMSSSWHFKEREFYYLLQYRIRLRQRLDRISQKLFMLIYAYISANQLHSWQGNHEMVYNTTLRKPKTCHPPLLCHHLELCSLEACLQMASFSPS